MVAQLKVGDRVRDSSGVEGTVAAFTWNQVAIAWDFGETWRYTDEGLMGAGVVKVSAFGAEDTRPE